MCSRSDKEQNHDSVQDVLTDIRHIFSSLDITSAAVLTYQSVIDLKKQNRAETRLPQNPQSVIAVLFPYYTGEQADRNVCRYATLPDYHTVCTEILCSAAKAMQESGIISGEYAAFADNSPFYEVELAIRAGLGFRGRNNLLISPKHGSFLFIGELVTQTPLPIGNIFEESKTDKAQSLCNDCGLCASVCPGGCINPVTGEMDYSRCVSAITQKKGELTEEEAELMRASGLAWGCDRCQDSCLYNQGIDITRISGFTNDIENTVTLKNIDSLLKTRAFGWRGRAVIERNLEIISKSHEKTL